MLVEEKRRSDTDQRTDWSHEDDKSSSPYLSRIRKSIQEDSAKQQIPPIITCDSGGEQLGSLEGTRSLESGVHLISRRRCQYYDRSEQDEEACSSASGSSRHPALRLRRQQQEAIDPKVPVRIMARGHIEDHEQELASFLPGATPRTRGAGKSAANFLSRTFRQRSRLIAIGVTVFVIVQLLAWGPDLVGRERFEEWRMSYGPDWGHHPPHSPPPPVTQVDDIVENAHKAPPPPLASAPFAGTGAIPQTIPEGYEPVLTQEDDRQILTSAAFPAQWSEINSVTKKPIELIYPKGDPRQGIIPEPYLQMLDREIPSTPPVRPIPVPEYPAERYTAHSGWLAAVNGSQTTFKDALTPEAQPAESDWRTAPYSGWKSSIAELFSTKDVRLPKIQHDFSDPSSHSGSKGDKERDKEIQHRQRLVRNAFLHSWEGYKSKAWGHDELRPVSQSAQDNFNGWGATIVDALDTLLVMDLPVEYDYARQHVHDIDFHLVGGGRSAYGGADGRIPVFETAIRYLGGFLAAYDLSGDELMRDRAEELAQLILPAFDTTTGVPVGRIRFDEPLHPSQSSGSVILAEAASLLLEMTRLWQVTGNRTYFDRVQRTTDWLEYNMTNTPTRLGTLWSQTLMPERGTMYGWYGWGGMSDSAYEYLIKAHQLLGGRTEQYGRMFANALDSALVWLMRPITTVPDTPLMVLGYSSGNSYTPRLEHLTCFAGGTMALSGKLLPGRARDLSLGRRFTETCYWAYNMTITGIAPESMYFYKEKDVDRYSVTYSTDGTSRRGGARGSPVIGTYQISPDYRNRPETIESVFYMWRTTGDRVWQERGWQMFCSWVTHSMTKVGFSSINSVLDVPVMKTDSMESFVFAETFKYYYLLFSPPDTISLDDYVFTTEAHPLLAPQKGLWGQPGRGPKKMWDPSASHLPTNTAAYTGGQMGKVGGLTAVQQQTIYAAWRQDVANKEALKSTMSRSLLDSASNALMKVKSGTIGGSST